MAAMGFKARRLILGHNEMVSQRTQPEWDFLYWASTVKPDGFNVGDRVDLPDGRVFRLAMAGGTVYTEFGCADAHATNANAAAPTQQSLADLGITFDVASNTPAPGAIGSKYVTATIASPFGYTGDGSLLENELCGAYIVIGNGISQHPQMRQITRHAALASAGSLTVELDAALTTAVTVGATRIEIMSNPYYGLTYSTSVGAYATFRGMPAIGATVGQYFWVQTKGACWITSNSTTCDQANDRDIYFVNGGSVVSGYDVTYTSSHPLMYQKAGVAMDASSSGNSNAPFVNLQLDS